MTTSTSKASQASLVAGAARALGAGARLHEMMDATNYVIAARMDMIGAAVRSPLTGNYRELNRMVPEKLTAMSYSGMAWFEGACELQRDMADQLLDVGMLMLGGVPKPSRLAKLASDTTQRSARALMFPIIAGDAALEPLHRTVTVNAKRLRGNKARQAA